MPAIKTTYLVSTSNRFSSAGNRRSLWLSERLAGIREANPSRSVRDRRRRCCRRLLLLLLVLLLREVVVVVVVVVEAVAVAV